MFINGVLFYSVANLRCCGVHRVNSKLFIISTQTRTSLLDVGTVTQNVTILMTVAPIMYPLAVSSAYKGEKIDSDCPGVTQALKV